MNDKAFTFFSALAGDRRAEVAGARQLDVPHALLARIERGERGELARAELERREARAIARLARKAAVEAALEVEQRAAKRGQ